MLDALQKFFGHAEFRRPQEDVIASILSGRDTLAIMPTGGGKSLCYQLPAMMNEGTAIVVSPLIALMKDQVDALNARGLEAAMINSSQSWAEQRGVLDRMRAGLLKLVYIAPERFRARTFTESLGGIKISLFAIDEAHCISQWGHDFRPDYMRLNEAVKMLGNPVCAAFTATATPEVKEDIAAQLHMKSPNIFVSGFARPNLEFKVTPVSGKEDKRGRILKIIGDKQTGIVYCATRKSVEEVSKWLKDDGVGHVVYHGGMTPAERDAAQENFVGRSCDVAVATNAFGMGIDRGDLRFVCHYELPGSVEAYYQEAGRAGRDGKPASCEMLFSYADKRVQEFFIMGSNPELQLIRDIYSTVKKHAGEGNEASLTIDEIATLTNKGKRGAANGMSVMSALSLLRKHGFIERHDEAGTRTRTTRLLDPDLAPSQIKFPLGLLEEKKRRDEAKLREVLKFAYAKNCRQRWILEYFGESDVTDCAQCDSCSGRDLSAHREAVGDEFQDIIKVLSSVARLSSRMGKREFEPRFGRDKIQKSLVGSRDARIQGTQLVTVSTYGILKERGRKYVNALVESMLDAGMLEITGDEFPLMGITQDGAEVMFGEKKAFLKAPQVEAKEKKERPVRERKTREPSLDAQEPVSGDAALLQKLRTLRNEICRQKRVPAFKVFANKTLEELASEKPLTLEDALKIKGVGPIKLQSTMPPFLKVIREHAGLE